MNMNITNSDLVNRSRDISPLNIPPSLADTLGEGFSVKADKLPLPLSGAADNPTNPILPAPTTLATEETTDLVLAGLAAALETDDVDTIKTAVNSARTLASVTSGMPVMDLTMQALQKLVGMMMDLQRSSTDMKINDTKLFVASVQAQKSELLTQASLDVKKALSSSIVSTGLTVGGAVQGVRAAHTGVNAQLAQSKYDAHDTETTRLQAKVTDVEKMNRTDLRAFRTEHPDFVVPSAAPFPEEAPPVPLEVPELPRVDPPVPRLADPAPPAHRAVPPPPAVTDPFGPPPGQLEGGHAPALAFAPAPFRPGVREPRYDRSAASAAVLPEVPLLPRFEARLPRLADPAPQVPPPALPPVDPIGAAAVPPTAAQVAVTDKYEALIAKNEARLEAATRAVANHKNYQATPQQGVMVSGYDTNHVTDATQSNVNHPQHANNGRYATRANVEADLKSAKTAEAMRDVIHHGVAPGATAGIEAGINSDIKDSEAAAKEMSGSERLADSLIALHDQSTSQTRSLGDGLVSLFQDNRRLNQSSSDFIAEKVV